MKVRSDFKCENTEKLLSSVRHNNQWLTLNPAGPTRPGFPGSPWRHKVIVEIQIILQIIILIKIVRLKPKSLLYVLFLQFLQLDLFLPANTLTWYDNYWSTVTWSYEVHQLWSCDSPCLLVILVLPAALGRPIRTSSTTGHVFFFTLHRRPFCLFYI